MKTLIPKAIDLLKSFAQQTVRGLRSLGATLGMTHNTEAVVGAALNALEQANAECQSAKSALAAAQAPHDAASEAVADFIRITRELLKSKLGTRYSVAWDQVGFFNRTLEVPSSVAKRLGLIKSMELYLEAHPELEVAGVMTQAMATALHETLSTAVNTLATARVEQRDKIMARDAAAVALDKRLRAVRRELKEVLSDSDSRWLEFGFNIPTAMTAPLAPTGLVATAGAIGSAVLSWAHSVGAARYRVFRQTVGVDVDFVHVDTLTELTKILSGLPSGTHVRFYVTAANEAGESLPSETVELVVP